MSKSIIKENNDIRQALIDRWKELNLKPGQIAADAADKSSHIWGKSKDTWAQCLSRYLHHGVGKNSLTEEMIEFLSIRWGVKYEVDVEVEVLPYDEKEAVKQLKKKYPKKK